MDDEARRREHRVARSVGRGSYRTAVLAAALGSAIAAGAHQGEPAPKPQPPKPPEPVPEGRLAGGPQGLRMVDDDGIRKINAKKLRDKRRGEKRARDWERQEAGKRRG